MKMAEENNIIDAKVVKAPKAYKGEKELWRHFNISLTGYVSGLSPQLPEMMKIAEALDSAIDPDVVGMTEQQTKLNGRLWIILTGIALSEIS